MALFFKKYVRRLRLFCTGVSCETPPDDRVREIAFHVKSGDYFSTMSTIMMLLEDSLKECVERDIRPTEFQQRTLHALKDEMMHLHNHYRVVAK